MPKTNADLAAAFEQTADLLELQQANPFRVRAYRNAARLLGELRLDLVAQVEAGRPLPRLPGIGADLAGKIEESNNKLDAYNDKDAAIVEIAKALPTSIRDPIADAYETLTVDARERYFAARERARAAGERVGDIRDSATADD